MSVDIELVKKFIANDLRSFVLLPEVYNQVLSLPPPEHQLQGFVDSLNQVKCKLTLEQKKAAYDRAKAVRDLAEVACKAFSV